MFCLLMDLTYNTNIRKVNERIDNLISLTNIFLSYSKAKKTNFNRYIIVSLKNLHPLTFEDLKSNDSGSIVPLGSHHIRLFMLRPLGESYPPRGFRFSKSTNLCDQRIGGAYWIPPSETRAFRVPAREIRQSFMAADPLTPS